MSMYDFEIPLVTTSQREAFSDQAPVHIEALRAERRRKEALDLELKSLAMRVFRVARLCCITETDAKTVETRISSWKRFGIDNMTGATINARLITYGSLLMRPPNSIGTSIELHTILSAEDGSFPSPAECVAYFHSLKENGNLIGLYLPSSIENESLIEPVNTENQSYMFPIASELVSRIEEEFGNF